MTDNRGFNLSDLLNPEQIRRYLAEQEATVQQVQNIQAPQPPAIDVPVVEVPPPVVLKGSLKVRATFSFDSVVGQSYEQIRQKVYDAIANPGAGVEWLPEVSVYDLNLWQERERAVEQPTQRPGSFAAAVDSAGRVPEAGYRGLPEDWSDPEFRTAEHGGERGPSAGDISDADGTDRGVQPPAGRGVSGPAGDGPDDSEESGAG